MNVMLSEAKHLVFSSCYEDEILRLPLRMTFRHSLFTEGNWFRPPVNQGAMSIQLQKSQGMRHPMRRSLEPSSLPQFLSQPGLRLPNLHCPAFIVAHPFGEGLLPRE
jgi:hypothetical protein